LASKGKETGMKEREILLRLLGGLAMCEHMGDVADDVMAAFEEMGYKDADFVCGDSTPCWDFMKKNGIFLGTMFCEPSDFEEDD